MVGAYADKLRATDAGEGRSEKQLVRMAPRRKQIAEMVGKEVWEKLTTHGLYVVASFHTNSMRQEQIEGRAGRQGKGTKRRQASCRHKVSDRQKNGAFGRSGHMRGSADLRGGRRGRREENRLRHGIGSRRQVHDHATVRAWRGKVHGCGQGGQS